MTNRLTFSLHDWIVDGAPLGSGGQAVVYRVFRRDDRTRQPHVAKVLKRWDPRGKAESEDHQRGRFKREVLALESLASTGCPNIVPVLARELDPPDHHQPWYVMPFYAGGPMALPDGEGGISYLEPYKGNIDRVLQIVESVALTLAWMHNADPQYVHRDVHVENIFFETRGGTPILGDFGLVHIQNPDAVQTGGREPLGPWRWRPPELHAGSTDKANPKSDVYLLGGVMYEALSDGLYIEETQQAGGGFTHELPDYDLAQFTNDPRIRHVTRLLRNMLARDPLARMTAREVASACRAISEWKPGLADPGPLPAPLVLEQAAAKYRAEGAAYRADVTGQHLRARCAEVARQVGVYEASEPYRFHRQVAANYGDGGPQETIAMRYPRAVWAAVRILVRFEPVPDIMVMSYVMVIRTEQNREIVALIGEDSRWTKLSDSFPDDPRHDDMVREATLHELDRLATKAASVLEANLSREASDAEFHRVQIPGLSCSYNTARLLRLLIVEATKRTQPYVEPDDVMKGLGISVDDFRVAVRDAVEGRGLVEATATLGAPGYSSMRIRPAAFVQFAPKVLPDLNLRDDGLMLLKLLAKAGRDGRVAPEDIVRDSGLPTPRTSLLLEFLQGVHAVESSGPPSISAGLPARWFAISAKGDRVAQGLETLGEWDP